MKKNILLLFLGITFSLNAQDIKISVPLATQEQSNWCGVAASQCVLRYYPPNRLIQQCVIMEWVRQGATNSCCEVPTPQYCNHGIDLYGTTGSVQAILSYFGAINSIEYMGSLWTDRIGAYLSNDRLLIISLENKYSYKLHGVVVYGMDVGFGRDLIYYMDPSPNSAGWEKDTYFELTTGFQYGWYWFETLVIGNALYPDHCFNCQFDPDLKEEGYDCGGPCQPCNSTPPGDHCKNHRHDPDLGETGIDCGGKDCPECDDCNNCTQDPGEDAIDCGGSCTPCMHVGGVPDEKNIINTAQLTSEVKAYKKITAGGATTVTSGKKVTFITDKTGSIVLLPGFTAESGSNFSTQMKDLSEYKRLCGGSICYDHHLSDAIVAPYYGYLDYLKIYNLRYAVSMGYCIYKRDGYAPDPIHCVTNYKINRDYDELSLWDCVTGAGDNPKGIVRYKIDYSIDYCNNARFISSHNFYVDYSNFKSLTEEPEEPENLDTPQSSSSVSLKIQDKNIAPSFSILPNPNPGTFQLSTSFPLSAIGNLKITNLMGVTVYETQNVTSPTIQLQNSALGMFFVVIILKDGSQLTQKMMIQR